MSIITRYIQLLPNIEEKVDKKEFYKAYNELRNKIRKLQKEVCKASNLIISHQWFNEIFAERILLTDKEMLDYKEKKEKEIEKLTEKMKQEKDKKKKEKLTKDRKRCYKQIDTLTLEAREQARIIFCQTIQNTTYQIIGKNFPNIPSDIKASLNQTIVKNFNNDLFNVNRGIQSIRNYKQDMPIPFQAKSFKIREDYSVDWIDNLSFKLFFGKDKSNNKHIIDSILNGTYTLKGSSITIKKNKIFVLAVVDIPKKTKKLNPDICVGVDLGINIPAYCSLNKGLNRQAIGSKDDFLKVRTQIQARSKKKYQDLNMVKGGKGRKKKLKNYYKMKDCEKNFAKTYNHMISKRIIDFALTNKAGVIKLELLEGFSKERKDSFILRNWSYYDLQTKIKYKAEREGIAVTFIDPYHTSQTCSCCGNYEKGQRISQSEFVCKKCGKKMNADYNASVNIARSEKYVEKKEDCEYFLKKKLDKKENLC